MQFIGICAIERNGQAINDTPTLFLPDCKYRHRVKPASALAAPASKVGNRPIRDFLTLGVEFPATHFHFSVPLAHLVFLSQR